MQNDNQFQYLNPQNRWPNFRLDGLEIVDGVLQLTRLPGDPRPVGPTLDTVTPLAGPAGVAVDEEGNIYLADPAHQRVVRVDACDGSSAPLPCLQGPGSDPGQLKDPRGMIVGPRGRLYIADSGNHRIQVVDLATQQVTAIWGQPDPYAPPTAGRAPGQLDTPLDLAADQDGYVYVVEGGNQRLQKFTPDGQVIPTFWETMQGESQVPQEPVAVATTRLGEDERLLVIDRANGELLIYDTAGHYDAAASERWSAVAAQALAPTQSAFDGERLVVADAGSGRVLVFNREGVFIGFAHAGPQPVAGLALDRHGRLLIHPGGGAALQQLTPGVAFVDCGAFLAGPFKAGPPDTAWHRLQVTMEAFAEGSHVQLFTLSSDSADGAGGGEPSWPAACSGPLVAGIQAHDTDELTPQDVWRATPPDATDFLLFNQPSRYLWLAGVVQGDGGNSPRLHQMRLTYNHETWVRFLPAMYQRDAPSRAFLDKSLALFESLLADEQTLIEGLPALFDAWAAPAEGAPESWLDWLSGWLAFNLDETWSEAEKRHALAQAFTRYARRGTLEGLRQQIALYAGAAAHVSEPARQATLWSLGETSTLGFSTALAPAHAQGAVVGTTATLDQSHLIAEEDYGAPLFEDLAHRFCVQVYAADLPDSGSVERVRRLVEREKPAHTQAHLCVIEPRMRIGFQARLGIDTLIGGPPPELVLDQAGELGRGTALPAPTRELPGGALGERARIGRSTTMR